MGRPGPALFELIRSGGAPPPRVDSSAKPPLVRITPKATPAAEPPPRVEPTPSADKPADRAWASWNKQGSLFDLKRQVAVPMSAILVVIGVGILVLVLTWGIAYTVGGKRGEANITRDLGGGGVKPESFPLNENLVQGSPKAPEARQQPLPERRPPVNPSTPAVNPPAGSGTVPVAGVNYLLLASGMDKDGADKMASFLTQNGLPAAAVVDKPASGSNNRGSYIVLVTRGLTSEEYKQGDRYPARAEVMSKVASLGKVWQKDHKGQTDFSQAYWKKF